MLPFIGCKEFGVKACFHTSSLSCFRSASRPFFLVSWVLHQARQVEGLQIIVKKIEAYSSFEILIRSHYQPQSSISPRTLTSSLCPPSRYVFSSWKLLISSAKPYCHCHGLAPSASRRHTNSSKIQRMEATHFHDELWGFLCSSWHSTWHIFCYLVKRSLVFFSLWVNIYVHSILSFAKLYLTSYFNNLNWSFFKNFFKDHT